MQVKLRNSGPWSITDFNALLKHGTTRQPARYHLDDPGTRYLLITNADTTGVARNLLVRGLEEWPEDQIFPASLSATLPHGPEGRIAIWGVLTERLLDLEINDSPRLSSAGAPEPASGMSCTAEGRGTSANARNEPRRVDARGPAECHPRLWRLSGQRPPARVVRAASELPGS